MWVTEPQALQLSFTAFPRPPTRSYRSEIKQPGYEPVPMGDAGNAGNDFFHHATEPDPNIVGSEG